MRKILIAFAVIAAITVLFSCNKAQQPEETTAAVVSTDEITVAETQTEDTDVEERTTVEEETTERTVEVGIYDSVDLDTCMRPLWEGRVVHNESVLFINPGDTVSLLYTPEEIISVRSSDLSIEYEKGVDYDVTEDGKLILLEGSRINNIGDKFYTYGDFEYIRTMKDGEEVPMYFSERFYQYQVYVTYSHNSYWEDKYYTQKTESEQFSRLKAKLENGENVTFTFIGDSITFGASASGMTNTAPYQDTWPEMFTKYLAKQYGYTVHYIDTGLTGVWLGQSEDTVYGDKGTITYINTAVGGWNTSSGITNFTTYIEPFLRRYGCDFFLYGFGMNDSLNTVATEKRTVKKLTNKIYEIVPDAEMVLLATMIPTPDTTNWEYKRQAEFEPAFYEIAEEQQEAGRHCAVANMTQMSLSILQTKRFRDYSGNNINHPNDFFSRVYAQTLYQTVIGY